MFLLASVAEALSVVPDVPVVPEMPVEDLLLLLALGEGGPEGQEKTILVAEVDLVESAQRVHLFHRTDSGPVLAQVASETHDVCAELAVQRKVIVPPFRIIRMGRFTGRIRHDGACHSVDDLDFVKSEKS